MKTSELTGALLDYWVAMAGKEWGNAHKLYPTMTLDPTFSGVEVRDYPRGEYGVSIETCVLIPNNSFRQDPQPFCPSLWWNHGGPIIEREGIFLLRNDEKTQWGASAADSNIYYAATPLVAAMRAYVDSKFGEEVEDIKEEK